MPLVLLFTDTTPLAFQHNVNLSKNSKGTQFAKNVVAQSYVSVFTKADNTVASSTNSTYVINSANQTSEIARAVYTINAAADKSTYSIALLKTLDGVKSMENALEVDHEQMILTASSKTDANVKSTIGFNYDGMTLVNDAAATYYGDGSTRIRFGRNEAVNGTTNTMNIESRRADGFYETQFIIENNASLLP